MLVTYIRVGSHMVFYLDTLRGWSDTLQGCWNTLHGYTIFQPTFFPDELFLFDLILYVPSTIFQLYRDRSSWVELVLS